MFLWASCGPNDEANRRCRVQRRSAENGNREDQKRTLTVTAASELSDWLGVTACLGNRLFDRMWRDQSCCSTGNRMETHVAEVKTRTPGVARDRNVWAYSRKMIAGLSDEVG